MKKTAFLICAGLAASSSFAGNLPVLGAGSAPTTVTVVIPQAPVGTGGASAGGGSAGAGAPGPRFAAVVQAFNSGAPVTFTGSPAEIQALADFAAGLPDGPVKNAILASIGG